MLGIVALCTVIFYATLSFTKVVVCEFDIHRSDVLSSRRSSSVPMTSLSSVIMLAKRIGSCAAVPH